MRRLPLPFLVVALSSCLSNPADRGVDRNEAAVAADACSATAPRSKGIWVSVLPDAGEAPFVDALTAATKSIRLMVYMLGEDGVFEALKERAGAGVDVRVILDGSHKRTYNQPAFDALNAAGVHVAWSDPQFSFMHAKAFVVDDREAIMSTGNFPLDLIEHERNYVARDDDPQDVASLAAIFDADWDRQTPSLTCTRLLVSPVNSKQRLLDLVNSAKTSLKIETLELADADVIAAIVARKQEGVDVLAVLADPSWNTTNGNADAATTLGSRGIAVRYIPKETMLVHVKSILVDGVRAYMGSENLTKTSLEKNREVGLVITNHGAVDVMTSTFDADYAAALPFAASDPCGGVTFAGQCDGSELRWCEGGAVQSSDCAAWGLECRFDESSALYDCL